MATNKNKRKLRAPKVADSELSRVVTDIYDELNKLSGGLSDATEQRIKITTISQSDLPLNPVFQTVTANTFTGDLTGNVTGNVTGDVTGDLTGAIHVQGKNDTGSTLTKGTPVYISGQVAEGQQFTIGVADSNGSGTMPSIGILSADVNDNAMGDVVTHGKLIGIDTSSFTVGDELYISNSGTLTATPPTGESNLLQKIAKVIRVDATDGQIYIMGAGRVNAVPNLDQGAVFIGDANNQAVASTFSIVNEPSPSGGGSLAYSNGTFTFTPADVSDLTGYIHTITTGNTSGLSSIETTGNVTLSLDVASLTAETTINTGDEIAFNQSGTTKKAALSSIDLSVFSNTNSGFITDYTVTQGDVTQHQAALSITESQISDLQNYLTAHPTIGGNAASQDNSGNSFIQDLTFDTNGHVTAVTSATASFTDTNYYPTTAGSSFTSSSGSLVIGDGTNGTGGMANVEIDLSTIDADKLDGQEGSYYLNYNNFSNTPSLNFDNYNYWTLTVGTTNQNITSQSALTLEAGDNVTLDIDGANVTINSSVPGGYIHTISTDASSGLTSSEDNGTVTLDLNIGNLTAMTATPDNQEVIAILEGSDTKQIALGSIPLTAFSNTSSGFISDYTVTQADVTQHQSALAITESQITFSSSFIELTDLSVVQSTASGGGSLSYNSGTGEFTFSPAAVGSYIEYTDLSVATTPSSGGGALSYNNANGTFSFTPATIPDVSSYITLSSLSVGTEGTASGDGSISYDNTNGVFTYTPPDLSDFVDATFLSINTSTASGGGSLSYDNAGVLTFSPASIPDVSNFITLSEARSGLSVGLPNQASGSGAISYSSSNGVFTYTPPDLSSYLTSYTETNDLTSAVTWANVPDANITSSSVTQHIVIGDPQPASGGGALAFTSGEFVFTPASVPDVSDFITLSEARSGLSVGTPDPASGSGGLAYSSSNGTFTYTPPDLSSYLTSLPSHNHDDLYYTETEVNSLLNNKDNYESWRLTDGSSTYFIKGKNGSNTASLLFSGTNDATVTVGLVPNTTDQYQVTVDVQTPAGSNYYLNSITGDGNGSAVEFDFAGDPNDLASFTHDFSHNHDDRYLQLSGGTVTNSIKLTGGSLIHEHNSDGGYISHPDGAFYQTTTGSHTGAIKITLPVDADTTQNDMVKFVVDVYDYTTNESFSVQIAGYVYSSTNEWVNCSANILADNVNRDFKVRFGKDSDNKCVWIGETTSTWSYPQIVVRDFYGGYLTDIDEYASGWSISFVTAFDDVDETQQSNFPVARTAQYLQTARTITLGGDLTGSASFDGSADITISAEVTNNSHTHDDRYLQLSGGILTGDTKLRGGDLFLDATAVNGTGNRRIRFTEGSSTSAGFQGGYIYYDGDANKLHLGMHDDDDSDTANDLNAITILRSNQNVGIGTDSPVENAKLTNMGNISLGIPGNGQNTSGRFISIEGNTDSAGEGSGRIFFAEHNSTTASMSNYGMSIGYRGGSTSIVGADGNTWTGLGNIANGEWGMWGHNNNATGALIMHGDRAATFVNMSTRLGINGDPNSSYKLDVNGAGRFYRDLVVGGVTTNSSTTNYESVLRVKGKNNYSDGTTWYGDYGQILLDANSNMTASARKFLITNALDNNKFAIVRSTDAGTDPVVHSTSASISSGTADFVIDYLGNAGIGTENPAQKLHVNSGTANFVAKFESTDDKASILLEDDDTLNYIHSQNGYLSLGGDSSLDVGNLNIHSTNGNVGIGSTNATDTLVLRRASSGQTEHGLRLEYVEDAAPTTTNASVLVGDYGLKFKNHNSGRNFLFETGNVGIGVTDPSVELEVGGSTNTQILISTTNNTGNSQIYFGDSDSDTSGIILYRHNGNSMAFEVNGSEKMRIDSSGRLGLGTTSPDGLLNLAHQASTSSLSDDASGYALTFNFEGATNDYGRHIAIRDANGDAVSAIGGFDEGTGGATGLYFATGNTTSIAERMRIDSSGNVDITGDLDVGGQLTISDSVASDVALLVLDNDSNGNGATIEFNDNSNDGQKGLLRYNHADSLSQGGGCSFHFTGEADTVLVVGNDSNSGRFVASGNSATEVAYGFRGDVNTGMYSDTADYVKLATAGVDRLTISSSGSIGINYNIPSSQYGVHQFLNSTNPDTDNRFAYFIDGSFSGADNTTADREQGGIYIDIDSSADGDASNEHRLRGIWCDVRHSGFSDIVHSGYFYAESNNTTEATSQLYGIEAIAVHDGGGSGGVNTLAGSASRAYADDAGSLNYVAGAINQVQALSARGANNITTANPTWSELELGANFSGNITHHYGVRSALDNNSTSGATITNSYLFFGDIQGTDPATNKYGIHIASSDRKNYFGGNVGIGTTSPSANLHVVREITTTGIEYPLIVSGQDENNNIDQGTSSGIGIKFEIAGNNTSGDSLVGASIVAMRESTSDANSSTGLAFLVSQNDTTLDEAVRIDENGNVGIGTTSPASMLNINTSGTANYGLKLSRHNSTTDGFEFTYTPSTAEAFIENKYPTSSGQVYGDIRFRTNQGGTQTTSMTIKADGNYLQVSNGITFGSDTANANRLDDYEEGTWTPTINGSADNVDGVVYDTDVRFGRYTKIGDTVHLWGRLRTDSLTWFTTSTNPIYIGGLPFDGANVIGNGTITFSGSVGYSNNWDGDKPMYCAMTGGASDRIYFYYQATHGGAFQYVNPNDTEGGSNGNDVLFQITYKV